MTGCGVYTLYLVIRLRVSKFKDYVYVLYDIFTIFHKQKAESYLISHSRSLL